MDIHTHIYNVCGVECKVGVFINKEEKWKRERGREAGCLECQRMKSWGQEKNLVKESTNRPLQLRQPRAKEEYKQ